MASRTSDVNLVIRAKNEASAGIQQVSTALKTLLGDQAGAAKGAEALAAGLAQIDKIGGGIAKSADSASEAISRQAQTLLATNKAIDERKTKVQELQRALSLLQAESGKDFFGPSKFGAPDAVAAQIKAVKAALSSTQGDLTRLGKSFDQQFAGLQNARSAYREIVAAQNEVRQAVDQVTAALGRQRQQMEAARPAASIRASQYQDSGKSAEASGNVFAQAGLTATEKQIAKTEQEAAAEKAVNATLAEQIRLRQNMAALSNIRASQYQDSGKSAEASASVFANAGLTKFEAEQAAAAKKAADELTAANEAQAKSLADVRAALNPTIPIYERLNARLEVLRKGMKDGTVTAQEFAAAEKQLTKDAERAAQAAGNGKPQLFGLKPYEVTNLGYQVNDVVTQLASGTSLAQTLAQQGGQLLQIFPKVGASIAAAFTNPIILGFILSMGTVVLLLKNAADQAERLRAAQGLLTASANGKNYDTAGIAAATEAMHRFGLSTEDAQKAVQEMIKAGIAQTNFAPLIAGARSLSQVFGVDLKQALADVTAGFSGSYDGIKKLDDAYNFLSGPERAHIRDLVDQGKVVEAVAEAQQKFIDKEAAAAQQANGASKNAVQGLSNAYHDFIDALSNTAAVQGILSLFAGLADHAERFAKGLREAANYTKIVAATKAVNDTADQVAAAQKANDPKALAAARRANAEAAAALLALQGNPQVLAPANAKPGDTPRTKQEQDTLRQMSLEQQLQELRDKGEKGLTDAETKRRIELAGQLAFQEEIEKSGSNLLATAKQNLAVEKERTKTLKENETAAKAAVAEREKQINLFETRVAGAEGGMGKNPFSTASGYGQFTRDTYLEQYKKTYGNTGLSDDAILATRQNAAIAKGVLDTYTRGNAEFLQKFGAQITAGNLYLVHFLGQSGAAKVLNAPNTPVDQLLPSSVLSGNKAYLYNKKGSARTGAQLQSFLAQRIGQDTGSPQSTGAQAIAKLDTDAADREKALNAEIDKGNSLRAEATRELETQRGLHDTALIQQQIQDAGAKAVAALQAQVDQKNANLQPYEKKLELTKQQMDATREAAEAEARAQHAAALTQAQLNEAQKPVNDLTAQRDALRSRIEQLRANGDNSGAAALVPQLDDVNNKLIEAIDNLQKFYEGLTDIQKADLHLTAAQIEAIKIKLQDSKDAAKEWGTVLGVNARNIAMAFANELTNAVDKFVKAVAEGQNPIKALKNAFLDFASSFLREIALMIIKQLAYNAAVAIMKAVGVATGTLHSGGIAGAAPYRTTNVSPGVFAGAMRFHTGGVVGLKADEVPAILQRGEEVITRSDSRHVLNGGKGQGGVPAGSGSPMNIKNIVVFNPSDVVAQAAADTAGSKVFITHVRDNREAYKAALGLI